MLDLDPRDWPAISALLDQALDLPQEARRSWLNALPQESVGHRELLARLLAAEGGPETDALLSRVPRFGLSAADRAEDIEATLATGARVGPYVLLAEIGRGGMGSVWLAERVDGQPRRKVALKLPHLGWAPSLAERLARERDILASLAHPNIARLYDAGVDELGRPYLALEHVDGTPIDRYAAGHALGTKARIGLVLQVAAAVAHAHAHLAVHRDLKPSNILVTPEGEVRLLDFGIAKLLQDGEAGDEAADLTRLHGPALTPDYASPEQVRGERVGTASDIYSLGVVAYELLAGLRPYHLEAKGARQLADAIDAVQIQPVSRAAVDGAVRRELEGDLDAILNKALKKDAAERYLTVQAFAADLERHLGNQPVLARPDTVGYRLRKYVARHALQVGAASVVALTLLAGIGLSLWQASEARRQAYRAEQEAQRAEQTKKFALSLFRSAESTRGAGAATTAVDLLLDAQRRIETELKDKPESAVELMTAIAESLIGQSKLDEAADLARKAMTLGAARLGADDPRTLDAEAVLGTVLVDLGRLDETISLLTGTVARARRVGNTQALITSLCNLGLAQVAKDQFDEGVANCRTAVELVDSSRPPPDNALAASAWLTYAGILTQSRRPGITSAAQRAIDLDRAQSGGRTTYNSLTGRSYHAAGLSQDSRDREALAEYETLLDDAIRFLGPNHSMVANIANQLGRIRLSAGYPELAAEAFGRALEATKHSDGANPFVEAIITYGVGNAQLSAGHWAESAAAFERVGPLLKKAPSSSKQLGWQAEARRSKALVRLGRYEEAELSLRQLAEQPLDPRSRAYAQDQLAALRSRQGRHVEAIALADEALVTLGSKGAMTDAEEANRTLGLVNLAAGRNAEAVEPLRKALASHRKRELGVSPAQTETAEALDRAEPAPGASAVKR